MTIWERLLNRLWIFLQVFAGCLKFSFPTGKADTVTFYRDMAYAVSKLVDQGLNFYEPFEVAGYPAYHQMPGFNRNWITTYALAYRYQSGGVLMKTLDQSADAEFRTGY